MDFATLQRLQLLQRSWPQTGAWQGDPQPLAGGTNNVMYRVETETGAYALRIAGPRVTPRRLRFEYDVIAQLVAAGLPFALPLALTTPEGEVFARFSVDNADDAEGTGSLATLTPFIAGARPETVEQAHALAAGEALGRLDAALAAVVPADLEEATGWRTTGDLTRCHPFVPDPPHAFAELPLAADDVAALIAGFESLTAALPTLYTSLPMRLSHEDFDPGNTLMVGERITGVLDFEMCGRDLRPMDLVVALVWWPGERRYGTGEEWPIIEALARGYGRRAVLDPAEVAAIPTLVQLRGYTSLVHRLGRWREGLSPLEHVVWRARAALERTAWLRAHEQRLIETVGAALA